MKKLAFVSFLGISALVAAAGCGQSDGTQSAGATGAGDRAERPALDDSTRALLAPGEVKGGDGAKGGDVKPQGILLTTTSLLYCQCSSDNDCAGNAVQISCDGCYCQDPGDSCTIAPDGSGPVAANISQPASGQWGGLGTGVLHWMTSYTSRAGGFGYKRTASGTFYNYGSYDVAYAVGTLGCKVADSSGVYMPTSSRTMYQLRAGTFTYRPYSYSSPLLMTATTL